MFWDIVEKLVLSVEKLEVFVHLWVCLLQLFGKNLVVLLGYLDCVAPILQILHDLSSCKAT